LSQTKTGDIFKELGKGGCFGGEKVGGGEIIVVLSLIRLTFKYI